jgi:hypothetical protein
MPATTRHHKSLAVLICGKTTGKTHAQNGDYIDIYNRFLRNSLGYHTGNNNNSATSNDSLNETAAPTWQFTLDAYNVFERQELPDEEKLDTLDAILITGSRAYALLPFPFLPPSLCFEITGLVVSIESSHLLLPLVLR